MAIDQSKFQDSSFNQVTICGDLVEYHRYAVKLAKQAGLEQPRDRHLLLAMLRMNRLFSRLDALFKEAGVAPKRLYKAMKQNDLYKQAGPEAQSAWDKLVTNPGAVAVDNKVEVEQLVLLLLETGDPELQQIFKQLGLKRETFKAAIQIVEAKSTGRLIKFFTRETLEVIVTVLLLVIIIKQGLGEFRLIPSESMLPELEVGDRVVVEKVTRWWRKPERGDIMVFYPPHPESILKNDPFSVFLRLTGFSGLIYKKESQIDIAFIKRLIGLPGDIVEVRPRVGVFVNGKLLDEPYVNEITEDICTFVDYCGPVEVPEGHYYLLGDNRNHSKDSRFWTFLPKERIVGRAFFRFWPLDNRFGLLKVPEQRVLENPLSG